jgi:N-acetylglucosaminyldiphosphoundecaprenol N-acetyl-beta-D-mannosaminyltransferase
MAICRLSVERGYRNFFYGGKPGVAALLSQTLQRKFPGLQVVGTYTPPFRSLTSDEEKEVLARVRESRPHILWVGLSTPKQERFMAQYVDYLQVPLMFGVGAAFDFHTGAIRDCSAWIKRAGLQWLHRLIQDPRHLWKRYLRNNPAFLWHIALQLSQLRKYPSGLEPTSIEALHVVKRP